MLSFENGGILVQTLAELPDMTEVKDLYLDFETTGGDGVSDGLRPYHGSSIAGICVTMDDNPNAWYIPIGHFHTAVSKQYPNLPRESVIGWLQDVFDSVRRNGGRWINHNVKFDAHFAAVAGVDLSDVPMICTHIGAKLINSDRGYGTPGYGLDELALDWLHEDISQGYESVKQYLDQVKLPKRKKCQDYGRVPVDIMAFYGTNDVLVNRPLYKYIEANMHPDCQEVWRTEQALTPVLFDIEREGLHVDVPLLKRQQYALTFALLKIEEEIHAAVGFPVRPHTNEDCFELLCNYYGLPVLGWTTDKKTGQATNSPSFDKKTLRSYLQHPDVVANPVLLGIVKKVLKYREDHTLLTYFVDTYLELHVDGVMHPSYNQAVRTGRLACKQPNAQQVSPRAKEFVVPPCDCYFLSNDYSQIEFRVMMHYGRDPEPIAAFEQNPDTDFHDWVKDMCGIPRKPAKNVNFCIGFGGGEGKVLQMLAADMELMGKFGGDIDEMVKRGEIDAESRPIVFKRLCTERAKEVYENYHATLPGIKRMTNVCANRAKARGWVKNIAGRHRHLPDKACWRAFNAVVQSSAADIMKRQLVSLSPRYNKWSKKHGIRLVASVHDEIVSAIPAGENEKKMASGVVSILEDVSFPLRVQMRASAGIAHRSWFAAGQKENAIELERGTAFCLEAMEAARMALVVAGVVQAA